MQVINQFNKKSSNENLNSFLKKINNSDFNDKIIKDFNKKIELFLNKHNISEYDDFIQYNYLIFLSLYKYQKESKDCRSEKTLTEFLNVSLRIIELYIFIVNKKLIHLKVKFFSINNYDKCIYTHFRDISNNISDNDICIKNLKKNKNPQVFLDNDYYKSSSMAVIYEKDLNNTTHFKQIFKLENDQVQAVFNAKHSINNTKRNIRKGNLSNRVKVNKHIISTEDMLSNKSIDKNSSKEEILDFHNTKVQKSSAVFKNYNITSKAIEKYSIDSSYKKHQINKAISTQLTKNNMLLPSSYNFPHIKQLRLLVGKLNNDENIETYLILCSIFCGISIKNLIYAFLNIHTELQYLSSAKIFRANIPKDIYALKSTNTVYIHLNKKIERLANILYEYFKNEKINLTDSTIDGFINKDLKKVKDTLNFNLKKLNKTTKLSLNNLHKCLRFYFNQFHKNSDVSILLHINLNQSDKAKACYIQQPKRLTNLENWINEFYQILTNSNYNTKPIGKEEMIGSPFFIKSKDFRNFIDDLDNLYLKNKDSIVRFNLQMIFIRYSLSLLLDTRDYKNSCDLYNFSKRLKILTIQEKAKNLKTAKRIIPLSDLAIKIINLFYSLKDSFPNFNSYSPKLLINKEMEEINEKSVKNYLLTICTKYEQDSVFKYLTKCKLNFGRHVFSTLMRMEDLEADYENELLGHFFLGNTGQGIYSNFNNLDYHKKIVNFIDKQIVAEYFPSKIYMLGECNEY